MGGPLYGRWGVHYVPGDPMVGSTALRRFVSVIPDDRHHLTMDEDIDIDGDSATVPAYTMGGTPPIISVVGTYHDSLTGLPTDGGSR